ncbi:MAG: DUF1320 family protein [Verrucomicrobia bacterium]|nr:DUF1320 family protein [Verrucomicrobiota bacterium]
MAYTTQSEIEALLPPKFLLQGIDDDNNETADSGLLTTLLGVVDLEIDGLISPSVALPLTSPYPAQIRVSALVLSLDSVYRRRGMADEVNPWAERAKDVRAALAKIGRGELALDSDSDIVAAFNTNTLRFHND